MVHTERIIFMEPAVEGNLNRSYFGDYLRAARKELSLSAHTLTEMVGAYGKVNHGARFPTGKPEETFPAANSTTAFARRSTSAADSDPCPHTKISFARLM